VPSLAGSDGRGVLAWQRAQPGAAKMHGGILRLGLRCGRRRDVDRKECGAWTC
jgi:hypothetical protein